MMGPRESINLNDPKWKLTSSFGFAFDKFVILGIVYKYITFTESRGGSRTQFFCPCYCLINCEVTKLISLKLRFTIKVQYLHKIFFNIKTILNFDE
jgi:hypothetical protein